MIGLDSAEPTLVLEAWRADLPNLQALMEAGTWGRLESCRPALPMPAWNCLLSGRDPGELGVYGPRNRRDRTYREPVGATSLDIAAERIWQPLSAAGLRCAILGVPGTHPPGPLNGVMVSSPLEPGDEPLATFPSRLSEEIEGLARGFGRPAGGPGFLDEPRDDEERELLLGEIRDATRTRFRVARGLLASQPWDLMVMVDIGPQRVQRGFWRFFDRRHRHYRPGNRFQSAVHDFYVELDGEIGSLIESAGEAAVLVASTHGARRLQGGVRINQWLIDAGYLRLYDPPPPSSKLNLVEVDWAGTAAWADGDSSARVFLNVEGREQRGSVPEERFEGLRDEIASRLEGMEDPSGMPMGTTVYRPERIYRAVRNVAPDLLVYFGDLAWRSMETFGEGEVLAPGDAAGAHDVNCASQGIFIYRGPEVSLAARGKERPAVSMVDVAPTLLSRFGLPAPAGMGGRPLF